MKTSRHNSAKTKLSFKSPVKCDTESSYLTSDVTHEYQYLMRKEAQLDEEISKLGSSPNKADSNKLIDLLHKYNDMKDATQIVLGKLANIQGRTVKEIHERYGLQEKDECSVTSERSDDE